MTICNKMFAASIRSIFFLRLLGDSFFFCLPFSVLALLKHKIMSSAESSLFTGSNDMACTADLRPSLINQSDSDLMIQEIDCDDESEYDGDEAFEEINRELCQFEEKPKPNLNDTEAVNLEDADNVRDQNQHPH
ncbi:uncharacterized protein LOC107784111 [Nicotiana tabacum]|uniref:Uncharacterized protein LOC107784111 n=2 Tax=Nicotiana tabacum TaxID=4097 RepID=A0AC58S7X3_TOBAC